MFHKLRDVTGLQTVSGLRHREVFPAPHRPDDGRLFVFAFLWGIPLVEVFLGREMPPQQILDGLTCVVCIFPEIVFSSTTVLLR